MGILNWPWGTVPCLISVIYKLGAVMAVLVNTESFTIFMKKFLFGLQANRPTTHTKRFKLQQKTHKGFLLFCLYLLLAHGFLWWQVHIFALPSVCDLPKLPTVCRVILEHFRFSYILSRKIDSVANSGFQAPLKDNHFFFFLLCQWFIGFIFRFLVSIYILHCCSCQSKCL